MTLTNNEIALISSALGILGTLGGVFLTLIYQQKREERTEQARWYADRKKAYSAFLEAAKKSFPLELGFAEETSVKKSIRLDEDHAIEHLKMINSSIDTLMLVSAEIEVIGSSKVTEAMNKVEQARESIKPYLWNGPGTQAPKKMSEKEWKKIKTKLNRQFDAAYKNFSVTAREDIGFRN